MNKEFLARQYEQHSETISFNDYFDKKVDFCFLGLRQATIKEPLIIDNYPYGFRYRTKIRYYIETTNRGDRFVSQTLNPKTNEWNNPKKTTYCDVMLLIANDKGHVTYVSCSMNDDKTKAKALLEAFDEVMSKEQRLRLHKIIEWSKAMEHVTVSVHETTGMSEEERKQHYEEQATIRKTINQVAAGYANKSLEESRT